MIHLKMILASWITFLFAIEVIILFGQRTLFLGKFLNIIFLFVYCQPKGLGRIYSLINFINPKSFSSSLLFIPSSIFLSNSDLKSWPVVIWSAKLFPWLWCKQGTRLTRLLLFKLFLLLVPILAPTELSVWTRSALLRHQWPVYLCMAPESWWM